MRLVGIRGRRPLRSAARRTYPGRMAPPTTDLGDLERACMEVLWAAPAPLAVREVHEALSDRGLAYTTVMTVLDRLSKKGLAERERDGRAWRYAAASTKEELTASALHRTLLSLDGTDRKAAMMHFLGAVDAGAIADLRAALAEVESRHPSP